VFGLRGLPANRIRHSLGVIPISGEVAGGQQALFSGEVAGRIFWPSPLTIKRVGTEFLLLRDRPWVLEISGVREHAVDLVQRTLVTTIGAPRHQSSRKLIFVSVRRRALRPALRHVPPLRKKPKLRRARVAP
jgi:hypothetical protein